MSRRHYNDNAPATTLTGTIDSDDTAFGVVSLIGFPTSRPYTGTLGRATASAEQVLVTNVVGTTLTVTRNWNGQGAFTHTAGEKFEFTAVAADFDEANDHINATADVHGVSGALVGTSNPQTLTNKTLSGGSAVFVADNSTVGMAVTTSADTDQAQVVKDHLGVTKFKVLGSGAATAAGLTNTGNSSVAGNETVTGTLTVTGDGIFNSDVAVTGDVTAATVAADGAVTGDTVASVGDITAGDDMIVTDDLTVGGDAVVTGALSVTGNATITGLLVNKRVILEVADATARNALTPANDPYIYRQDMKWIEVHDGSKWRVQGVGVVSSVANLALITDPVDGQLASLTAAAGGFTYKWNGSAWKGLPAGILGTPSTTSSNGSATTGTTPLKDTALPDYEFTAFTGRRYRLVLDGFRANAGTANDRFIVAVRDGGSSSPATGDPILGHDLAFKMETIAIDHWLSAVFTTTAGVHTVNAFYVRNSGTGSVTPTGGRSLYVEDLGDA